MARHRIPRVRPPSAAMLGALLLLAQPAVAQPGHVALAVAAPLLVSPLGQASFQEPLLDWQPVATATSYRVQISSSSAFSQLAYDVQTIESAATPEVDLAPGTWSWRVRANAAGGSGPWSAATFVKTATVETAPTQLQPADGAVIATPAEAVVLAWTSVTSAASYQIEFSPSPGMTDPFFVDSSATSYVVDFAKPGNPLYWRVRALARNHQSGGPYSPIRSFETAFSAVPSLTSPANGASVRDIELEWTPLSGVLEYVLEITPGPEPDWTSAATQQVVTMTTRYAFEDPNAPIPSTWAWRVRARDGAGNDGSWSPSRLVTRVLSAAPSLTSPANGATVGENPSLSWSPVVRAAIYQVDVSPDPSFGTDVATYHTTETTFDLPDDELSPLVLVKGGTYYWRVRGVDDPPEHMFAFARPASPWSSSRTFVFEPAITSLVSPPDGATVEVPTLRWDPVNAIEHRVTIKDHDGEIVDRTMTFADTYTPAAHLDPGDGPFSWFVERVALPGDDDAVVAWRTPSRTFSLTPISAPMSAPTPLLPDGSHDVMTPSLAWTPVLGADYYRIFLNPEFSSDTPPEKEPNAWNEQPLHYPAFTYALGNLDVRSYTYVVRAYDINGDLLAHGPLATFVIDGLDPPTITGPADCGGDQCPVYADSPRLSWDPVEGAIRYHAGSNAVGSWNPGVLTMATSAVLPRDLDRPSLDMHRSWWVTACVEQRCSAQANAEVVEELPPVPQLYPHSGSVVVGPQVTFQWDDLIDAATPAGSIGTHRTEAMFYQLGLVTSDGRGSDFVDGLEWAYLLPSGDYEWRVVGNTPTGATKEIRVPFSVVYSGPTQTAPGAGATVDRTPNLSWNAAPFAREYDVELFRGASISPSGRVLAVSTTSPSFTPLQELDAGTYTWRVRTARAGAESDWTTRTFTISGGSAPTTDAPVDAQKTANSIPQFDWELVASAVAYRFEIASTADFVGPYQTVVTGQSAWVPLTAYPSGTWHWRVAALGPGNAVLAFSPGRLLVIDTIKPTVASPTVKLPPVGSTVSTNGAPNIDLAWSGSDGQSGPPRYDVALSTDGNALVTIATSLTSASLRKALSPGHSYRFAIRATDGVGNVSGWISGSAFELRRKNEENTAITYVGAWKHATSDAYVNGAARFAKAAGSVARFSFRGRQVAWIAAVGPTRGTAKVYVDGVLIGSANLNSPDYIGRRVVFTRAWSQSGAHKLRIVVSGTAGHPRVDVDAFLTVE